MWGAIISLLCGALYLLVLWGTVVPCFVGRGGSLFCGVRWLLVMWGAVAPCYVGRGGSLLCGARWLLLCGARGSLFCGAPVAPCLCGAQWLLVMWGAVDPCFVGRGGSLLCGAQWLLVMWSAVAPCFVGHGGSLFCGAQWLLVMWGAVAPCYVGRGGNLSSPHFASVDSDVKMSTLHLKMMGLQWWNLVCMTGCYSSSVCMNKSAGEKCNVLSVRALNMDRHGINGTLQVSTLTPRRHLSCRTSSDLSCRKSSKSCLLVPPKLYLSQLKTTNAVNCYGVIWHPPGSIKYNI